jgi:N-acetylmuramoyl-L-alanine amidase
MPRIETARSLGLSFQNVFGALGPETYVTGHWTAAPAPKTRDQARGQIRSFHRDHRSKGWGGLGYHYLIGPDGTIYCGRPTTLKGAHVGGHNSRNIGVAFLAGPGNTPTAEQSKSYRWLLRNAHTRFMPSAHRTDLPLMRAERRGHKDWAGHASNQCPGSFHRLVLKTHR